MCEEGHEESSTEEPGLIDLVDQYFLYSDLMSSQIKHPFIIVIAL
jgi:hypothetical protein